MKVKFEKRSQRSFWRNVVQVLVEQWLKEPHVGSLSFHTITVTHFMLLFFPFPSKVFLKWKNFTKRQLVVNGDLENCCLIG